MIIFALILLLTAMGSILSLPEVQSFAMANPMPFAICFVSFMVFGIAVTYFAWKSE